MKILACLSPMFSYSRSTRKSSKSYLDEGGGTEKKIDVENLI